MNYNFTNSTHCKYKIMKTPYYIFDLQIVKSNYYKYKALFPECEVYYSTKANSDKTILHSMIPYVDGIEISSIKEFDILKRMKFDITRISYGIPIKSREEIEYLGMHGCKVFVADSICELMKIRKSCPTSTILLRLNVSKYIGKCIEYGIDFEMLKDSVLPEYDGFIFHISNCNLSDHLSILDKVEDILKKSAFRKK